MALFMKIIRGSHNRAANQRTQRLHREALRKREDPALYQVKQKLKKHLDPKYSTMTDEELTREAMFLTNPESLKALFSDLTHKPIQSILEEESSRESTHSGRHSSSESDKLKNLERVGQLTLKLHLSHLDETPSSLTRLGAALLKIPYGVLHAVLEIGDTSNLNISYMLEFNDTSLVQPRRKSLMETTALEATIPLGGAKLKLTDSVWPKPVSTTERDVRRKRGPIKTGIDLVDEYLSEHKPIRPRSICITEKPQVIKKRSSSLNIVREGTRLSYEVKSKHSSCKPHLATIQVPQEYYGEARSLPTQFHQTRSSEDADSASRLSPHTVDTEALACAQTPNLSQDQCFATSSQAIDSREDLTPYIQLSLSKILLIEKLVKVIIKYNKSYYYNSITRNCQTFVIDVLQSFGVWDNFRLGERLELYLKNLTKGRKEVYKSHKSINDRVKYLVISGELEDTTYDEARYLRSLYTVFHLEESTTSGATVTCADPECLLKVLEDYLKQKRPEGATMLMTPEHYM